MATPQNDEGAPAGSGPVLVTLANDDPIIIEGLRSMLADHPDRIRVVATLLGEPEVSYSPEETPYADVLLLDAHSRRAGGIDAARRILAQDPDFRVVIFTDATDQRLLLQALRLGVAGYLRKSTTAEQLVADLEAVRDGEVVVDRELATRATVLAARRADIGDWPGAHLGLSSRESEVLVRLAQGRTPKEVAGDLGVSIETVRTHVRHLYRKLEVTDRAGAVAAAWREGVVS